MARPDLRTLWPSGGEVRGLVRRPDLPDLLRTRDARPRPLPRLPNRPTAARAEHDAGHRICRDCAGITRDFFCDRCGFEGLLLGRRLCERCTLADTLARLLDDGTGRVAPSLQPLVTALLEMDRPKSRLIWLRNPNVVRLLRGLATGTIPLTHDGLHQETPWRTVAHLRDLLMDSGVLPRVDRQLMLYQRWLTERLAAIEDPEHRRLLRHFATWHQMRRLRARRRRGRWALPDQPDQAGITQAGAFLAWLAGRGRTIEHCQQADLDAWHTEKLATRRPAQTFLRWCMKTGRMSRLTLPPGHHPGPRRRCTSTAGSPCSGGSSTTTPCPCGARVAAALVLLYAQPVSRIVRLTIDDVTDDGTTVTVRLGDPPSPLPEPVADLMRAYSSPASTCPTPAAEAHSGSSPAASPDSR